jgi:polar amino acid transport system substrate-binding protein
MKILAALLLVCVCALAPVPVQALTILTEEDPPYNFTRNGTLTGVCTEIVQELLRRTGTQAPIRPMPWARAFHLAETEPDILLYTLARTPEREHLFSWIGPFTSNQWVFFARRGSGIRLSSLDDARALKSIGVYRQDVRHTFLVQQGFTNLDVAVDAVQTLRQLFAGRVDALLLNDSSMPGQLAVVNRTMDDVESLFTVRRVELHAGFSRGTDPAVVQAWTRAFQDMVQEGFVAERRKAWGLGTP